MCGYDGVWILKDIDFQGPLTYLKVVIFTFPPYYTYVDLYLDIPVHGAVQQGSQSVSVPPGSRQ